MSKESPSVMLEDSEPVIAPQQPKRLKPIRWMKSIRFSGKAVDNGLKRGLSIFLRSMFLGLILIGSIFFLNEMSDSNYSLEEISVPQAFHDAGYTGQVVASRIFNRIGLIIKNERLVDVAREYKNANALVDLNLEVVGIGIPIRSITTMLRETLGIDNRKKIAGNLAIDGDTIVFDLNINGDVERFYSTFGGSTEEALELIVSKSSEAILKHSNPYVLARHYLMRDAEGCFTLGRYILNKHQDDPDVEPIGYFALAGGYLTSGQFETAERVARSGVEKYPYDLNLQAALSTMLHRTKKYKEAIAQCKKVLSMLDENTPTNRIARSYLNLAYLMEELNKRDSAIYYANIVLARDKDFGEASTFIGKQYYLKGDTLAALNYWTSAFDNGLRVSDFFRMMNANSPDIVNDPKVKALIESHHDDY